MQVCIHALSRMLDSSCSRYIVAPWWLQSISRAPSQQHHLDNSLFHHRYLSIK
jgi:hypothetical protein